jgi:hypothetical protein
MSEKVIVDRHGRPLRTRIPMGWKGTVTVFAIIGVVYAVVFPMVLALDRRDARPGPMYEDIARVGLLVSDEMRSTGQVRHVDVTGPAATRVDGQRFTPSDGVRIVVDPRPHGSTTPTGYCVFGWNADGDKTPCRYGTKSVPAE